MKVAPYVGQVVNLRRIGNPPARSWPQPNFHKRLSRVRRIGNPQQYSAASRTVWVGLAEWVALQGVALSPALPRGGAYRRDRRIANPPQVSNLPHTRNAGLAVESDLLIV
jgi:hypothetical protein